MPGQRCRAALGSFRIALGGRLAIAACQRNLGNHGKRSRITAIRSLFRRWARGAADEECGAGNQ
jgi:hypothetical protein